jgi:hypothetical protein
MKHSARLLLLLAAILLPAPANAKSYSADRYDVDLRIGAGGEVEVRETVIYRFEGGPFRFAYRDIASTKTDGIEFVEARMDGALMPLGDGPGEVEIREGKNVRVTWHFPETSDATKTFTLVYRVHGVIRQSDSGDELRWAAIPPDRGFRVGASNLTLHYPPGVSPITPPGLRGASGASAISGESQVQWILNSVKKDRAVTVTAVFPSAAIIQEAPLWQQAEQEGSRRLRAAGPGAILLGLGVLAAVTFLLLRMRPEKLPQPYSFGGLAADPPSNLPPAMAARLLNAYSGVGSTAAGSMLDLARRGFLTVSPLPKSRWSGPQFQLGRGSGSGSVRRFEQELLSVIFKEGQGGSVKLSDAQQRVAMKSGGADRALMEELAALGLVDPIRKSQRSTISTVSVLVMLGGIGAAVAGLLLLLNAQGEPAFQSGAMIIAAGIGLFWAGVIGLVAGVSVSPLTLEGVSAASRWSAYSAHLKQAAQEYTSTRDAAKLERDFAYAAAFGHGHKYAERLKKHPQPLLPLWMQAAGDDGGAATAAFLVAITASSGGGAGATGGSAGASGGGGAGAG